MINKQSRTEEATEETPENSIQTKSTKQKTDLIYKIKPRMKSELIIYPYNINEKDCFLAPSFSVVAIISGTKKCS